MPTERRLLTFVNEELSDAIHAYAKQECTEMPTGRLVKLTVLDDGDYAFKATFVDDASDTRASTHLTMFFVTEALIYLCIERKIPIPRKGIKKTEKFGDGVGLEILVPE